MHEVEEELKRTSEIPKDENLISLQKYKKKGKIYYRIITYSRKGKSKRRYHIHRKLEPQVLSLWKEYGKLKKQEKEIKQTLGELLRKYQNSELIRKAVEELLPKGLKREAKDYAGTEKL